jgi:hypothetical protein
MPTAKKDSGKPQAILIQPAMLEPISKPGDAGYVPLCATLHWIMTSSGTRTVEIDNEAAWIESVEKLFPLLCEGLIELIGLPCGRSVPERVQPLSLALVRVLSPLEDSSGIYSPAHISTSPFVDEEHWLRIFNDQLYYRNQAIPAWTLLQVRKSDVLSYWPKPSPKIKSEAAYREWLVEEMTRAPRERPQSKEAFRNEAMKSFPLLGLRQFNRAWTEAINKSGAYNWSRAGAPKKRARQ